MPSLTATYRLQMNAGFTLAAARARVAYFARLGVSHLYLSPILAARRGSMHGYDVVDPSRINPEIGTDADLRALAADLHERDMGLIVDIVPNHMSVGDENWRWDDVLAHGERSRFARWFDIDWHARAEDAGKVVLPILGDDLDRVLERGELSVRVRQSEAPRVIYYRHSFPLDSATLPPELQLAAFDPEETGELADLFSGTAGRERLRGLLAVQHYRLTHWRHGPAEINYRRFFDVNDLVALRAEDGDVFRETHALILTLVNDGVIDGLRVDHVDGLRDPLAYLERLRAALPAGTPIVVEKILSGDERLRCEWPVAGTTGYEFLNDLEDVFIEPEGFAELESTYRRLRRLGATTTFREIARAGKIATLDGPLRADVDRLVRLLAPIARASGTGRTADDLRSGVVSLIAELPVYRTYIDGRPAIEDADCAAIDEAARRAASEHAAFVAGVLLDRLPSIDAARRLEFVQRFQQVSGPATAKGVEDTALYVYVPLLSRNEVGGAPDHSLDNAVSRLHQTNQARADHWPLGLIATNTHDTKRSADVRARLDALSELPHEWERSLRRWRRLNARHRKTVKGRLAPDTNTEYLLYQILVALWPPPRPGRRADDLPDRSWRDSARERLCRYALKAAREAKTSTNWTEPSAAYETALGDFVAAILEPREDAPFLPDVARLVSRVAPIGAWNALSRIVVHLMAPGTPDIYQGDELWNFTLVDPDNRRQVDYDTRATVLANLDSLATPPDPFDNRMKLLVTHRLLALRRERADLFTGGDYRPLEAAGARNRHVVAFARTAGNAHVIAVVTRLPCTLLAGKTGDWWGDTRIDLPEDLRDRRWRSWLGHEAPAHAAALELGSLLRAIPVAVLAD